MKPHALRFAALAAASAVLAACTASGNLNVTPTLPGASAAPSAGASAGTTAAPSAAPTTGMSAAPGTKPSTAASAGTTPLGNDSFDKAFAATIDTPFTGEITTGDNAAYFKVTVPAGAGSGWLAFEIDENDNDFAPKIAWFNGKKVDMNKDTFAAGSEHPTSGTIRAKAGNTYYVTISPDANAAKIAYNAKFTWSAIADKNEPNDTFETATAIELGKAVAFATFWADDQGEEDSDYFKLVLPEGKTKLKLKLENKNDDESIGGYGFVLFNASKAETGATANTEGGQSDLDLTWDELSAGTYFVRARGDNGPALSEVTFFAE